MDANYSIEATTMNSFYLPRLRSRQRGVTMVELLAAMMIMSLIMVPLFGMLKASLSISETSSQRQSGAFTRQAALEAIGRRLQGSKRLVEPPEQESLTVIDLANFRPMTLRLKGGQLILEDDFGPQVLIDGIAELSFYDAVNEYVKPTSTAAGRLIGVDVATRSSQPPYKVMHSSTKVWIRPAI